MSFVQSFYDWSLAVERRSMAGSKFARVISRLTLPFRYRAFKGDRIVTARVWEQDLRLGADHHLPHILLRFPKWAQSLVHVAQAIGKPKLSIIDVGANIGDSVAMLEQAMPGACTFLCVEPDPNFSGLCATNIQKYRAELVREFIGDSGEKLSTTVFTSGTAETKASETGVQSRRLDEVAADFVSRNGLDLIKVDTDGYDFKVLRSASGLIEKYRPVLFFEMHPTGWVRAGESGLECFRWLKQMGYVHFSIFNNDAYLYSSSSNPDDTFCESLFNIGLARYGIDSLHFDIMASPDANIRDRAAQINLERMK